MRVTINYTKTLEWLRWAAIGLAVFVVTTVAGGFILQLCQDADWYKHAWKTVAAVIAAFQAILASPTFHWLGGGALGLALGIWLDDLLRRLAAKQPTPKEGSKPEKGYLDYQADLYRCLPKVNKLYEKTQRKAQKLGGDVNRLRGALDRLSAQAKAGHSARAALKLQAMASEIAALNDKFSDGISKANIELAEVVRTFGESVDWMTAHTVHIEPALIAAATALRDACRETREAAKKYVGGLSLGVSADLNTSVAKMSVATADYVGLIDLLIRSCTRMIGDGDKNPLETYGYGT